MSPARGILLDDADVARNRVKQLFRYLYELHQYRNPLKRQLAEQPWYRRLTLLPIHETISVDAELAARLDPASQLCDDAVIRVERPLLCNAPELPPVLHNWVQVHRSDPKVQPLVHPERLSRIREQSEGGEYEERDVIERFEESTERIAALSNWEEKWRAWAEAERPARQAMQWFDDLYALYGAIEREGDAVELLVADGMLTWHVEAGSVRHPLIFQRVRLELQTDRERPAFSISETEDEPELYSGLLQSFPDLPANALASFQEQFEAGDVRPFGGNTTGFLRGLVSRLSARGTLVENAARLPQGDGPTISIDPVLFLRRKMIGFAAAAQRVVQALDANTPIPSALVSIVGVERMVEIANEDTESSSSIHEPDDVLLSKPANDEQIRIAERLNRHGAVLVQGPPGTGKSHTIANLIGHLLAQGKSVLVTSHTSKALKVLRDHVVEELKPLCVTVLDDDVESRRQLETAVTAIVDRISASDKRQLVVEAETAADQRAELLTRLRQVRIRLRDAIADEYRAVVIDGRERSPADAARFVAEHAVNNAWIPRPIVRGAPLPLALAELADLYATNERVSIADEAVLADPLPPVERLPSPVEFGDLLVKLHELDSSDGEFGKSRWAIPATTDGDEFLQEIADSARAAIGALTDERGWEFAVVAAGRRGPDGRQSWESLAQDIERVAASEQRAQAEHYQYGPELPRDISLSEQSTALAGIVGHVRRGGSLGKLQQLVRPAWKRFIESARIGRATPRTLQHFEVLERQLILEQDLDSLAARWARQMETLGAIPFKEMGKPTAAACKQFAERMWRLLEWTNDEWPAVEQSLADAGFDWRTLLNEQPFNADQDGDLIRLRDAARGPLQAAIAARRVMIWRARALAVIEQWVEQLSGDQPWASNSVAAELRSALINHNVAAYSEAHARLLSLSEARSAAEYRAELLNRLYASAEQWAIAIARREGIHGGSEVPGDPLLAWEWSSLTEELEYRANTSIDELQRTVDDLLVQIRRITAHAIDRFTWAFQLNRINLAAQQALVGWQAIMRRIGAGTGRRVPQLRIEARKAMQAARVAVPVWIMPLSRVADSFDPRTTTFDVVIIDEASQSDITSLLAVFLGKQVLVVGDHEQVSPSAVGQDQQAVDALIRTYLTGIPNAALYDGRLSVYDLARMAFGGTIALREHFRCVPEIIAFSNSLAYDGRIKPLRESTGVNLKPHVVPFRVDGASAVQKVNEREAQTVVCLIGAMIEQPEYTGKTFGVVSLVGEEQAIRIMQLLANRISAIEMQKRKILCGNAAQFQGDERDVMVLSLVDAPSPSGGPLAIRQTPEFKQRFNVAASRARDQMWVVYSLDPSTDLKPGDLRRQLIQFALDPNALKRAQQEAVRSAESPFETAVIERLVAAGYRVRSQVEVGYYRIDIVVEGGGKRLAVECDGDRWHPLDAIPADMARQAVLERMGWTFVRIRGSAFFQDPELAMKPVFQALIQSGVIPEGIDVVAGESSPVAGDLRERITRRAAELSTAWFAVEGNTT